MTAGTAGNEIYRSGAEATQAVFTSLMTGLEFIHTQRLGRPLGTYERPRPTRAEARRSDRSQRNVVLNLMALRDMTSELSGGQAGNTITRFDRAITVAERLDDPSFAGVADPSKRIRIGGLQNYVAQIQEDATNEIGAPMGISAGFNSLDGD